MLLIWNSFIGQFVHPVGGEDMGKGGGYLSQLQALFYQSTRKSGAISNNNMSIILQFLLICEFPFKFQYSITQLLFMVIEI